MGKHWESQNFVSPKKWEPCYRKALRNETDAKILICSCLLCGKQAQLVECLADDMKSENKEIVVAFTTYTAYIIYEEDVLVCMRMNNVLIYVV